MQDLLTRLFKTLRARQQSRARELRARTDAVRKGISAHGRGWDGVSILRAIRDGR